MNNVPINPVEVQSKVVVTVKKMIVVAVLVLIAVILLGLNEYGKGPMAWCFEGKDVCTLKAMDKLRAERDSRKADLQKQIIDTETYYNNKINPLKSALTGETISNELKAGRKQNVPESILGFRLVPQVMADELTEEVVLGSVSWSPDNTRYTRLLTELGSPYANVPIELYCREAGITIKQCDILVAIPQSEGQSGKDFKSDFLPREEAVKLGQTFYHNPVGMKDLRLKGERERTHPDENGMYLRRFDSWDAFWRFYPAHMKTAYFDRGGTTPEIISKCYVRGDCKVVKQEWANTIHQFINKI
jgi:hypothetical protein